MRNVNKKNQGEALIVVRPYTDKEKKMVADWLKNNKIKTSEKKEKEK